MLLCGEGAVVGFGDLLGFGGGFADAAGATEGIQPEVAALLGPLVVLFGEHRADKADDRVAVGEDADDVGAAADLPVEPLVRIVTGYESRGCLTCSSGWLGPRAWLYGETVRNRGSQGNRYGQAVLDRWAERPNC